MKVFGLVHALTLTSLCAALAFPFNSTFEKRASQNLYVSHGPVIADIAQDTANCWLAATLVGVANLRPMDISHKIVQHHPLAVSVSLPAIPPESARDRKAIAASTYDVTYQQATGLEHDTAQSGGWWVAALEYALIRHTRKHGSDQGVGAPLTLGFTGLYGRHYKRNLFNHELSAVSGTTTTLKRIQDLLELGDHELETIILLGTLTGPTHAAGEKISITPVKRTRWLVKGHAYVVTQFARGRVTLVNPWNPQDPKTFKLKDLAPYVGEIALLDI